VTCSTQYANTGDPEALDYCLLGRRLARAALFPTDGLALLMTQHLVAALLEMHAVNADAALADEALDLVTGLMRAVAVDGNTHGLAVRALERAEEHGSSTGGTPPVRRCSRSRWR
jgi:hypothetical protein